MDYSAMTAAALGRAIASGKADAAEIARHFLDRIEQHPKADEIYVRVTAERALEEAAAASGRAREGRQAGPLDGVPVSWKDLYDTRGIATESGAPLLKGRVPQKDARVLAAATAAGTVCLGKTHQTEFAFSGLGINPNTATPPNLLMPGHVPGGSSSGAAASITHGLAPVAIGSDTGGSVRIPACWNSLVGMKTTHGLLSLEGVVPLCAGFDTVGPIARTVEDAALMTAALGGPAVALDTLPSAGDLRFAVIDGPPMENCDKAVLQAFEAAVRRLGDAGVSITRIDPSAALKEALSLGAVLFPFEAWQQWGSLIGGNPGIVYPPVETRFRQGALITGEQYDAAWLRLDEIRKTFFAGYPDFDGFLFPTIPMLPPGVDELLADDERFTSVNLLALRNTRFVNLLGSCALTLPVPEPCIGVQIMGRPMADARLLQTGMAMEAIIRGEA